MDTKDTLDIQESESQTSFHGNGDSHQFVIAEPHDTIDGAWVESKFSNNLKFETRALCKNYIDLNKTIPRLFKTTLRPKRISELLS